MVMEQERNNLRIADMSLDDRPREKALRHGIRTLSDTELLAILIGGGLEGKSVIDLSKEIYRSAGNDLSVIARTSIKDLCARHRGIGPAKAITIAAALELGARRRDVKSTEKPQIRSSADAYACVRDRVENLQTEEFWVIVLSRANRVIALEKISSGGTTATVVEAKVVMKRAIDHLACGIILAHNHPSGNTQPSPQDDTLTHRLCEAGKLLEIPVLDHLIITPDSYYSYADQGRLR